MYAIIPQHVRSAGSAVFLSLICLLLTACEKLAEITTPKKKPISSHSQLFQDAETYFWETLHGGQYEHIPTVTKLLTAAYLENPNDPILASHLGFVHIWKIAERQREKNIPPTIVDDIILARKYFSDAVELHPEDARNQGFLGDCMLIEGKIFKDNIEQMKAYFLLKYAIKLWPQFNYFTAGYPLSTLDAQSDRFKEALDWQWKTLTLCAGTTVSKTHPDFSPYLIRETQKGAERACWNSWIAPHNFEGFFLNMGDMLVKQGDWQTAINIYNNAKLSKTYSSWPYRSLLETHLKNAKENVAKFQKPTTTSLDSTILFNSGFACAVCHQKK